MVALMQVADAPAEAEDDPLEVREMRIDPSKRTVEHGGGAVKLTFFEFEILLDNPQFERIVLPFTRNLERMGVTARVRTVDNAQYQKRMETFDYDMAVVAFGESLSPGNEQRDFWGSQVAAEPGSRNLIGIKNKVIDELIEALIRAPDRASLVAHTLALDRVLQYGYYVVPHYHIAAFRVAHWDKFKRPAVSPKYAVGMETCVRVC